MPQVKKAYSEKSTEYFSQDIPFYFYENFSTFQYFFTFFFKKHLKILYFFGQLQMLKKKVKGMLFLIYFFTFYKKAQKALKSTEK